MSVDLLHSTISDVIKTANCTVLTVSEKLELSEQRLYKLIDSIQDIIVIKDTQNRWLTINSAARNLFGFYKYEYVGKTNTELLKLYPRLGKFQSFHEENEQDAWESRKPIRYIDIYNLDDHVQYFDVMKFPSYFDNGTRSEMIIIARDITDQILEQQKTRACFIALNASSDAITILDKDFNIFFVNFKFATVFDRDNKLVKVSSFGFDPISINEVLPERYHVYISQMIDVLRQNQIWQSNVIDSYEITGVPIMNGCSEPIFHIITFKTYHGSSNNELL